MLKKFIIFLFVTLSIRAYARQTPSDSIKSNLVSIELLGNGLFYSFNYQHYFATERKLNAVIRVGLNWHPFTARAEGGSYIILGMGCAYQLSGRVSVESFVVPALSLTFKPIPRNEEEREIARNNPEAWGQPFENKFQKILGFNLNFRFMINSMYSIGIAYTPMIYFDYGLYSRNRVIHSGALSINKHF